ncbi:BON domain-containing protein [Lysobacter sp. TY2-98]|nr:BON domain-containing protein [Lysobacter sp. TY2-98]
MSDHFADADQQQAVLDELAFEPGVDGSRIGVAAAARVITLGGHVESYAQKMAAERATWRVKGAKAIVDTVDVHRPADGPTDEDIVHRALALLRWDGTVPDERAAWSAPGVRHVVDRLVIG